MNIKVNTVFSEDDKAAYQIHRLPKVVSVFFGVERERGAGTGTNHGGEDDGGGEQRAGEPLLQANGDGEHCDGGRVRGRHPAGAHQLLRVPPVLLISTRRSRARRRGG